MIGVGVESGKLNVHLMDPPTENPRLELQQQIWDAVDALTPARVKAALAHREHGPSARETTAAWDGYTDALRQLSNLIRQV